MQYISILSTLIAFVYAAAVFVRYGRKGGLHLLFWGIGLVFYGLGTLTEVLLAFTYNALVLRLWYLSGAMLTAAWLGQGTLNLLVRRKWLTRSLNLLLVLASLAAAGMVFFAPLTDSASSFNISLPVSEQYKDIMIRSGAMILMTVLLNIYGTLTLVGGAIYSGFLFWRKKVLLNRVIGNILIAGGALLPATAGTFIQAGLVDWLYISELLGIILMFLGYIQASAPQPVQQPASQPVA